MNQRELFLRHVAQTSPAPLALEIVRAEGSTLIDAAGKHYIDLIGGISVANTGHRHPAVLKAIHEQLDAYLHIMVYGEFVEAPQVQYAQLLTSLLPPSLDAVYFTNSGAEAVEAAMKLAKRVTGRTQIYAFKRSYHGSTQGALSIIGDEYWRNAYRPLLPDVGHLDYNSYEALAAISERTACVIAEPVQAEAGIIAPDAAWLQALRKKCSDTGTLLIMDEIQTGFGRTGTLWGITRSGIVPDLLLLGKALGGGMPLGACVANRNLLNAFTHQPVLGHITTFGGHPVSCAAGMAGLKVLLNEQLVEDVARKEQMFLDQLSGIENIAVRSSGLWLAIESKSFEINKRIIDECIRQGVLTDWFLFADSSLRISPPLVITDNQVEEACAIIRNAITKSAGT